MFRVTVVAVIALLIALAACGEDGADPSGSPVPDNGSTFDPVTPITRPPSVPEDARVVRQRTALGQIERRANEPPETIDTRNLLTAACDGGVMVLWTSEEVIHAALPCERFWDTPTVQAFSGQEVAIVLDVTDVRYQIFIETVPGAQSEFTVDGIWLQ